MKLLMFLFMSIVIFGPTFVVLMDQPISILIIRYNLYYFSWCIDSRSFGLKFPHDIARQN